ncbi:MAG: RpiB/LacA/LacB family sugar-phosphate isomerase [Chloroflexota bacterium]
MKVALAADHGGVELKNTLAARLSPEYEVLDLGAHKLDPDDDYPDFAVAVARVVLEGRAERGILICGSGVGACVAANKVRGIRAATCHDTYSARQGVEDDDLNVLCLGARVIGTELAVELANAFLKARFSGKERHRRRRDKVISIEKESRS